MKKFGLLLGLGAACALTACTPGDLGYKGPGMGFGVGDSGEESSAAETSDDADDDSSYASSEASSESSDNDSASAREITTSPFELWEYDGYVDECDSYTWAFEFRKCDYDGDGKRDRVYRKHDSDTKDAYYTIQFGNGNELEIPAVPETGFPHIQGADLDSDGLREILTVFTYDTSTDPLAFGEIWLFDYSTKKKEYKEVDLPFIQDEYGGRKLTFNYSKPSDSSIEFTVKETGFSKVAELDKDYVDYWEQLTDGEETQEKSVYMAYTALTGDPRLKCFVSPFAKSGISVGFDLVYENGSYVIKDMEYDVEPDWNYIYGYHDDDTGTFRENTEWTLAYSRYLSNRKNADDAEAFYALIYLNDDCIPELYIDTGFEAGGQAIVTYNNGSVVEHWLPRRGARYVKGSGLIYTDNGAYDSYVVYVLELKDGFFNEKFVEGYYVSDEDRTKMINDENYPYTLTYELDDKKVSEEEFYRAVRKAVNIDISVEPDHLFTFDEMQYYLKNGKWFSYGHRYEFIKQNVIWQEAQEICKSKGGYLAAITCLNEAEEVTKQIKAAGYKDVGFYVGYRSSEKVGDDFYRNRWIMGDGSYMEISPSGCEFWHDYYSEGKYTWMFDREQKDCGLTRYSSSTDLIEMYDVPDDIISVMPKAKDHIGFICEYDQ